MNPTLLKLEIICAAMFASCLYGMWWIVVDSGMWKIFRTLWRLFLDKPSPDRLLDHDALSKWVPSAEPVKERQLKVR